MSFLCKERAQPLLSTYLTSKPSHSADIITLTVLTRPPVKMLQATQASLLGLALLFAFWRLYIALLSSLAKLPNAHPLAPWTKLWLLWLRRTGQEHRTRYQLHQKLGPVIRLGPSEVSVNCIEDGVQIIYGNDFDKSSWFANFDFYG